MEDKSSEIAIRTENLTKIFKIKKKSKILKNLFSPKYELLMAVNNLNISIKKGEIYGLLGPNGAGKTTAIQMICGLLFPTKGNVFIKGVNLQRDSTVIKNIGVMFSDKMIYNRLTGYHNLKYFSKLYRIDDYDKRIREISELLNLTRWLNKYVEYYSLGMRTKLAIARTLLHDPEILLLDEPTIGLDVVNANFIRELLKKLNKTILLTTHYINEAEILCDRIGFLFKGKLFKTDTPLKLKQILGKNQSLHIKTTYPLSNFIQNYKNHADISEIKELNDREIIISLDKADIVPNLIKTLSQYNIKNIIQKTPSLEQIFIQLTKETIKN